MLSFSANVLFINKLHSKSFLSNFWGAVHNAGAAFFLMNYYCPGIPRISNDRYTRGSLFLMNYNCPRIPRISNDRYTRGR